ncbi:hypothetical protein BJX66DRAFT_309693 [Aspergillus keveii]|uniref:Uncharacterized protein n=1 Tax=Aspergillus keveii TaxID=714993 RepID=A0ABR4FXI3_9EURO
MMSFFTAILISTQTFQTRLFEKTKLTIVSCPFPAANKSGVRPLEFLVLRLIPFIVSRSLNTSLCPLPAAHESGVPL